MRYFIYLILTLTALWAAVSWGGFGFFLVGLPCMGAAWVCAELFDKWEHARLLEQYRDMLQNIYVWSEHEHDRTVRQRAEHERTLLRESGNQTGVQVHTLYYQDAGHTCETWEEFEHRVAAFIAEDRTKRHAYINSLNRVFFETHVLNQK